MPVDAQLAEIVAALRAGRRFLVASHVTPEGDTVGSQLAICLALQDLGKQVVAYNADPIPRNIRFLPYAETIVGQIDPEDAFDAAVVVDAADLSRIGPGMAAALPRCRAVINIDHHKTNTGFGDLRFVDPNASATGEVVYRLLKAIPVTITHEIAVNIYVTLLTDTGSFQYTNATPEAFRIAGEMVSLGVRPWSVAQKIYESNPAARMRLLARVLDTLEVSPDGTVATIVVTRGMLEATGCTADLTDGFINFPRSIEGVEVAVMLREEGPDLYKVSLRSRGNVDVSSICSGFGGGGHRNAAGALVRGPLADVKASVLAAAASRVRLGRDQFMVVNY
jgi:bifunctional oligoribonuclease and PAP phosphatase NrnA